MQAYQTAGCSGMARVDVFLTADNEVVINEINTLPGFTNISMYPKLWQASGLDYTSLITRLIELALERHAADRALKTSMNSKRVLPRLAAAASGLFCRAAADYKARNPEANDPAAIRPTAQDCHPCVSNPSSPTTPLR